MKLTKKLATNLSLAILTFVLVGWRLSHQELDVDSDKNTIVLLKFKAQPEKGSYAISQFSELLKKVKEEPNFVSIKLHVDPNDNTNILLYEEWEDKNYYNTEHMNTEHLKEFMKNSSNFLTGPPEITFWDVKQVFK